MKNKILLAFVFFFGVFFPFTSVHALTKINFEQQANGKIETKLHFEEGFVGGIDITFNVNGNVEVENFKFSDKITSGGYGTEFKYDKTSHKLTVRVTTGGVGQKHNLLNEKKELDLGTMEFTTSEKENVNYSLSETAFKIVDNTWASKTIEQTHITLGETTKFVYEVENKEEEPPKDEDHSGEEEDDKKDEPSTEGPSTGNESTEKEPEKNTGNNSGNNTTNDKENNSGNNTNVDNNTTTGDENTDNENNNPTPEKPSDGTTENESTNSNETKEDKEDFPWMIIVIASLAVITVGCGIYFLVLKKRNQEND